MFVSACVQVRVCNCVCALACVRLRVCVLTYMCMCVYVCACVCGCMNAYMCLCVRRLGCVRAYVSMGATSVSIMITCIHTLYTCFYRQFCTQNKIANVLECVFLCVCVSVFVCVPDICCVRVYICRNSVEVRACLKYGLNVCLCTCACMHASKHAQVYV